MNESDSRMHRCLLKEIERERGKKEEVHSPPGNPGFATEYNYYFVILDQFDWKL